MTMRKQQRNQEMKAAAASVYKRMTATDESQDLAMAAAMKEGDGCYAIAD